VSFILSLADTRRPNSLASRLRRKRFALLRTLLDAVPRPLRILDVGGTAAFWSDPEVLGDATIDVTLLNVALPTQRSSRFDYVRGDARALDFADKSFDVVYSNSVIEHVGGAREQGAMAREIRRVGKRYFVQTPNYFFPIEPHFLVPGFQFMPLPLRAKLLSSFDLGWSKREPDIATARAVVGSVTLLRRREFARFFPGATIYDERYLGLTKSFIAYHGFVTSP
jgi:hypothetical protein